jgi:hypothetical protein
MTTWILEVPQKHVDFIVKAMERIILDGSFREVLEALSVKDNIMTQTSMEYVEIEKK